MSKRRNGFTLVELVVVVMILGILAAVAAPRLLDTSDVATDNGCRQTLAVVRDAIERFAAENGGDLPGADNLEATFVNDLRPFLRGGIPRCPVGNGDATVKVAAAAPPVVSGAQSWAYSSVSGEFIINSSDLDNSNPQVAYSTY